MANRRELHIVSVKESKSNYLGQQKTGRKKGGRGIICECCLSKDTGTDINTTVHNVVYLTFSLHIC